MSTTCRHVVLLFALLGGTVFAQTTASLSGTVADDSGAVVPLVRVTVTNIDTGVTRSAESSEGGLYQFPLLQPGTYNLAAQKEGFKQVTREGIRLEVNQAARIDFTMPVGAVSETVEVKAAT